MSASHGGPGGERLLGIGLGGDAGRVIASSSSSTGARARRRHAEGAARRARRRARAALGGADGEAARAVEPAEHPRRVRDRCLLGTRAARAAARMRTLGLSSDGNGRPAGASASPSAAAARRSTATASERRRSGRRGRGRPRAAARSARRVGRARIRARPRGAAQAAEREVRWCLRSAPAAPPPISGRKDPGGGDAPLPRRRAPARRAVVPRRAPLARPGHRRPHRPTAPLRRAPAASTPPASPPSSRRRRARATRLGAPQPIARAGPSRYRRRAASAARTDVDDVAARGPSAWRARAARETGRAARAGPSEASAARRALRRRARRRSDAASSDGAATAWRVPDGRHRVARTGSRAQPPAQVDHHLPTFPRALFRARVESIGQMAPVTLPYEVGRIEFFLFFCLEGPGAKGVLPISWPTQRADGAFSHEVKAPAGAALALLAVPRARGIGGASRLTDYRGDVNYFEEENAARGRATGRTAAARPRRPRTATTSGDTGRNHQPGRTRATSRGTGAATCSPSIYRRRAPARDVREGQGTILAWPTKNHAAASCTNHIHPDTSTEPSTRRATTAADA